MSEWRIIPGWPEYEATQDGKVRRVGRAKGASVGKVLKATTAKNGYPSVDLCRRSRVTRFTVAHVLCLIFHGPRPSPKHQAAHWDGNTQNNTIGNVRWATATENSADRDRHGTMLRGEESPHAVLSEANVLSIRRLAATGLTHKHIAANFGISRTHASHIIRRERWTHI